MRNIPVMAILIISTACGSVNTKKPNAALASSALEKVDNCQIQGTKRLSVRPQRAIGTEPFWSVTVQGRCIDYSQPKDVAGKRIWTRFSETQSGRSWSGYFEGKAFKLSTGETPSCSNGMSDKLYPMKASLLVSGEHHQGCAEFMD